MQSHLKLKPKKEMAKKSSMNEMVTDDRPCFFKIIFDGLTTKHLRIPPAFVKYISNELSDRAILRGPTGDQWNVLLCMNEDGIYMKDGWELFFRDHSLGKNEFLLFRYDGKMFFDVQIFDQNGCERDNVPTIRTHHESGFSVGKRPRGRPRKLHIGSLHLNQSKSCKYSPGKNLPHCEPTKIKKTKEAKGTRMKTKTQEMDLPIEKMKSQLKIGEEGTQRKVKIKPTQQPNTRCGFTGQRPPTDKEGVKVWSKAESFTSKFPYFKLCMKESSVDRVFLRPIPLAFARAHLPQLKSKIVLRTSEGKSWEMVYLYHEKYRMFSGGWRDFVCYNKLKVGDICIFELVAQDELQVHIFRQAKISV